MAKAKKAPAKKSSTGQSNKQTGEIGAGKRGPGRPKGSQNKVTADVKGMILTALADAGGAKYLLDQAKTNPTAFLTLIGKVLPKEVTGADGKDLVPAGVTFVVQPVAPKAE